MATTIVSACAPASASSSPSVPTGTPFVWAKLVAGKKMDLKTVQEEERQEATRKEKERNALKEKQKEDKLREDLAKQKRDAEFDNEVRRRFASYASDKAARDEKYSVANGWWESNTNVASVSYTYRDIPKVVNAHALKFAQLFLHNFGEKLSKCTTLFELEALFQEAYVPYALKQYWKAVETFETFEKAKYKGNEKTDRYLHMQEWMLQEEKEWNATPLNKKQSLCPPWVGYDGALWIFVKNVNFQNFIKAIDEKNGAFEKGVLKISGDLLNMATPIEWTVSLDPYAYTNFREKDACLAKKKRIEKEEREEDWF